jgi:hypothetical protein
LSISVNRSDDISGSHDSNSGSYITLKMYSV